MTGGIILTHHSNRKIILQYKKRMTMDKELNKLRNLQGKYLRLRNEKLATGIIIKSPCGNFEISNPSVIMGTLDFLIREISEQIKKSIDE